MNRSMEIEGICSSAKLSSVKRAPSVDQICFSQQAEKLDRFVEMLKLMPDIRDDFLFCTPETVDPKKIASAIVRAT